MSRPAATCLIAVFCLAASPCGKAYAQRIVTSEERERRASEMKFYRAVVDSYRAGQETAVKTILSCDVKRIDAIVSLVDTTQDPTRPWTKNELMAAAMLHTDAALELLVDDQKRAGFELDSGGRLLVKAGPEALAFSRDWYSRVVRTLRANVLFTIAAQFLESGRRRLPNDVVVLYESGLLYEHIATFAAYLAPVDAPGGIMPRSGPLQSHIESPRAGRHPGVIEQQRALTSAAEWLAASVALDRSDDLVSLHLARVQMLRGDPGASKALERLIRAPDPSTAYLAAMFLGAMETRKGRHAAAEVQYRAALLKLPGAQSVHVALSETLQKLGRGDEARTVVRGAVERPLDAFIDPWWIYLIDPPDDLRRQLAALRGKARQ